MTLRLPMKKAKSVSGMARPSPRISEMFSLCAVMMIAPAQKKSVYLPKACMGM